MTNTKKEVRDAIPKGAIKCSCGFIVTGTSQAHAETQLKMHKKSKRHKKFVEMLGQIYSGNIIYREEKEITR